MSLSAFEKWAIRKKVRGTYKAMRRSIITFSKRMPGFDHISEYGKLAVGARTFWKEIDENTFMHKQGMTLRIEDTDSGTTIISNLIEAELTQQDSPCKLNQLDPVSKEKILYARTMLKNGLEKKK